MLLPTVTMARDCPIAFLALLRLEKLEASLFLPQGTFEKFLFLYLRWIVSLPSIWRESHILDGTSDDLTLFSFLDRPF